MGLAKARPNNYIENPRIEQTRKLASFAIIYIYILYIYIYILVLTPLPVLWRVYMHYSPKQGGTFPVLPNTLVHAGGRLIILRIPAAKIVCFVFYFLVSKIYIFIARCHAVHLMYATVYLSHIMS